MTTTTNSALGSLLTRLAPIEPREIRAVVAAFSLFFFMWAGYFAVRPVRETVAINFIGRENVADLWLFTALFSILIIPRTARSSRACVAASSCPASTARVAVLFALVGLAMQTGGNDIADRQGLLRLHQRHESDAAVDVLELPARAVRQRPDEATVRRHRRGRQRGRTRRPVHLRHDRRHHRRERRAVPRRGDVRARDRLPARVARRVVAANDHGAAQAPTRTGRSAATCSPV